MCRQTFSVVVREQFELQRKRNEVPASSGTSTELTDSFDNSKAYNCAGAVMRSLTAAFAKVAPVRQSIKGMFLSKEDAEVHKLPVAEVNSK